MSQRTARPRAARPSARLPALAISGLCGALLPGCADPTVIVVTVTGPVEEVAGLRALVTLGGHRLRQPEEFPSRVGSFGLRLPRGASGPLRLRLQGLDAEGCAVLGGEAGAEVAGQERIALGVPLARLDQRECARWARSFGGAGNDSPTGIAAGPGGEVVVVGVFEGTVDLGAGPVASRGGEDAFVVKYSSQGELLWARTFGGSGTDRLKGVAIGHDGDIVAAGHFDQPISPCGAALRPDGVDALLLRLAPDGTCRWAESFGGAGRDVVEAVVVDHEGLIAVAGQFQGTASFDPLRASDVGVRTSAMLSNDAFLARYFGDGRFFWAARVGEAEDDVALGVAVDPSDRIALSGASQRMGRYRALLAVYPPTRPAVDPDQDQGSWLGLYPASGDAAFVRVAMDGRGDVIATGYFAGEVDLGDGPRSAADTDAVLAKYRGDGRIAWARGLGSPGADQAWGLAVDRGPSAERADQIVVGGFFQYELDLGGPRGRVRSAGLLDAFVARYTPEGAPLWARSVGGANDDRLWGLALDGAGRVPLALDFGPDIDLRDGYGSVRAAGGTDVAVAQLVP